MRILDYIHQGGSIMYVLLVLNIFGFALMLSKYLTISKAKKNIENLSGELSGEVKKSTDNKDPNILIELCRQHLAITIGQLEKGLNTIKIIAGVAPLIGLLGTVVGIYISFTLMAQSSGVGGDPKVFAEGISLALITTVGGLLVAIPHLIGHSYLIGLLDEVEAELERKVVVKVI
jgi:biopolymer transport protein ExbB